jgi:hypothetical protein
MVTPRRYWFPLAALGFALLVMVAAELFRTGGYFVSVGQAGTVNFAGLGTGGVGGTGGWYSTNAVAVSGVNAVPSATLGWPVGLACVVLAVACWHAFGLRRAGTPPRTGRFVLGTLGVVLAVPVLDLVGYFQLRLPGDVRGALLATLGLLVLAGYARSRFLLAVAVVFPLVTVLILPVKPGALFAAGLLFAAAFAVLLRGPVTAADTP